MRKYDKIETVFERDVTGSKKLLLGKFRDPTVAFLQFNKWIWTEKIDGMNIRVHWDGHTISYGGRTDNAQLPVPLYEKLEEYFGGSVNEELFEQNFGTAEVTLYGEGYGLKIQNGGDYIPNGVDFALFDVQIGDYWQPRENVEYIATIFGVKVVPIVGTGNLHEAVSYVCQHPNSVIAEKTREMEGVVCRPAIELQNRNGKRMIIKIKWEDFKVFAKEK